MQGYFAQFLAYTMAMVGFMALCLLVYKKLCMNPLSNNNQDVLSIENVLRINAKKQIYIIKAGNERFLVASDAERTTMLAKLEEKTSSDNKEQPIVLKKAASTKHLGNVIQAISDDDNNSTPMMKRISEKMKA